MSQVFFDPRQFVAGQQVQREQTTRNALADLAPAAIGGDQNALAQLAQYAPEMAMNIQDRADARDVRQQGLAMERERVGIARQRLSNEQRKQAEALAASQSEQERAATQTALQNMLLGAQSNNPQQYAAGMAALQQLDETVQPIPMQMFPEVAHTIEGMSEVWANVPAPEPGYRPATQEELDGYGFEAGQVGPNNRFYPLNQPSGTSLTTTPDGGIAFNQGPGVAPAGRNAAVTATPRDGGTMSEALSKGDAATIARLNEGSQASQRLMEIGQNLETLAPRVGYTGPMGGPIGAADTAVEAFTGGSGLDGRVNAATRDVFRSEATKATLTFVELTKGAVTEREMDLFQQASPGLARLPEGNKLIAQIMQAGAQRVQARAAFNEAYAAQRGSLQGAEAAWTQYMNDNPIITANGDSVQVNQVGDWRGYLGEVTGQGGQFDFSTTPDADLQQRLRALQGGPS